MRLPQKGAASGPDQAGYNWGRGSRDGAPARDVSWHPHYPVLASTSFDSSVKVWGLKTTEDKPAAQKEEVKEGSAHISGRNEMDGYYDEESYGDEEFSIDHAPRGGGQVSINQILRFLMSR